MKNKTFFHIIYISFCGTFFVFCFFLGSLKCFFFHSITLSDLQRATKTLRWLLLGLFSLHTCTVCSALMTVYYFALQKKCLVEERRRSKWGRKESFQRASNRANINVINNSNNSPHARRHTHSRPHIYCTVYPGFTVGATVIGRCVKS